ncbi:TadE/TadG family type IV pilus assembly protein [Thalassoroseus pseudoceratinae]|uniref:TadE/TadG family type IV pilus assembly protein n=1 Tax=Thalassoroseus pseudoceratinae TaxID=2713176 RepID=UPI00141F97C0|nr:TadE family protein [Thalassoroseus pseudoceratinae]
MFKKKRRRIAPSFTRRAIAATEFAIVLPLLVYVTLACIDLGRVAHTSMVLVSGVSSAGEFAATFAFTSFTQATGEEEIRSRIVSELELLTDFDPSLLTTSVTFDDQVSGQRVITIEASFPVEVVTSFPGLPSETVLSHQLRVVRYR